MQQVALRGALEERIAKQDGRQPAEQEMDPEILLAEPVRGVLPSHVAAHAPSMAAHLPNMG